MFCPSEILLLYVAWEGIDRNTPPLKPLKRRAADASNGEDILHYYPLAKTQYGPWSSCIRAATV
jgi:hypothetical protein